MKIGHLHLRPLTHGSPPVEPRFDVHGALAELSQARLRLLHTWWWRMDRTWSMPTRTLPNGLLYIPINQVVKITIGTYRTVLKPGHLAVMPAGMAQAAHYLHQKPPRFDLLCLHLTLDDAHGRDLLRRFQRLVVPVPHWPHAVRDLRLVAERWHGGTADGMAYATLFVRTLLADVIIAAGGLTRQPEPDPRIARCLARIANDPSGRLTVDDLAHEAGVSTRRLRDLFRSATGVAPKEYLIRHRIAEATRRLADPTVLVKDVAKQLGFATDHDFHACFRKVVGMTPSAWRVQPSI